VTKSTHTLKRVYFEW